MLFRKKTYLWLTKSMVSYLFYGGYIFEGFFFLILREVVAPKSADNRATRLKYPHFFILLAIFQVLVQELVGRNRESTKLTKRFCQKKSNSSLQQNFLCGFEVSSIFLGWSLQLTRLCVLQAISMIFYLELRLGQLCIAFRCISKNA